MAICDFYVISRPVHQVYPDQAVESQFINLKSIQKGVLFILGEIEEAKHNF